MWGYKLFSLTYSFIDGSALCYFSLISVKQMTGYPSLHHHHTKWMVPSQRLGSDTQSPMAPVPPGIPTGGLYTVSNSPCLLPLVWRSCSLTSKPPYIHELSRTLNPVSLWRKFILAGPVLCHLLSKLVIVGLCHTKNCAWKSVQLLWLCFCSCSADVLAPKWN